MEMAKFFLATVCESGTDKWVEVLFNKDQIEYIQNNNSITALKLKDLDSPIVCKESFQTIVNKVFGYQRTSSWIKRMFGIHYEKMYYQ